MKNLLIAGLLFLIGVVTLASCAAPRVPSASTPLSPVPMATQTLQPLLAATQPPAVDSLEEREVILRGVHQIAEDYGLSVQAEEAAGNLHQSLDPASGELTFQLVSASGGALYAEWDNAVGRIESLNHEYMELYGDELETPRYPLPDPRPVSEDEIQQLVDAAGSEYRAWLEQEAVTGTFVMMFDPYEMRYHAILVGDSYVRETLRWAAVLRFRLELLSPPPEEIRGDIEAVQRVLPGEVRLEDVGTLMPMYTDRELRQYSAGEWRVHVDGVSHQIVVIDHLSEEGARHETQAESGEGNGLTPEALEQQAVEFIERSAPGTDLGRLTPVHDRKGNNFLFRWEDRARPLLPDGRSYPFVQVSLSIDGEPLNYYNTL